MRRGVEQIGVRAERGAQRGVGRRVVDAGRREADRRLERGERGGQFRALEAVDRTGVEAEERERLLQFGVERGGRERGLLASDLGDVDVGRVDVGELAAFQRGGGEPAERRVAVLVDGDAAGRAVVVDVLAGVQLASGSRRTSCTACRRR